MKTQTQRSVSLNKIRKIWWLGLWWDYDDEEYRGIRDSEHLFGEVNKDDEDYFKPERVRNAFKNDTGDYNYIVYESRGSKYYERWDIIRDEITCLIIL